MFSCNLYRRVINVAVLMLESTILQGFLISSLLFPRSFFCFRGVGFLCSSLSLSSKLEEGSGGTSMFIVMRKDEERR